MKMILRSIRTFWYKGSATKKETNRVKKQSRFLKNSSPSLKADFHQQVNKSMKSTIHKRVANVTPVTNPTPMSKSDKYMVKTMKPRFSPKNVLARFRESLPIYEFLLDHDLLD